MQIDVFLRSFLMDYDTTCGVVVECNVEIPSNTTIYALEFQIKTYYQFLMVLGSDSILLFGSFTLFNTME